jgi:putative two-component system hydrogenase maturation factor HypX/HoxX
MTGSARALASVAPLAADALRILFVTSAHNSLSRRALVALSELGHRITVEVVDSGVAIEAAVERHRPEPVVCPMLKTFIPESVWTKHRCLILHPGPKGDQGRRRWTGRSSSGWPSGA